MKYFQFSLILLPFFSFAQSRDSVIQLNRPQWNKTLNSAFLSILGGKTDNSNIGNYASIDPTAGSFSFKGSIPIGNENTNNISYLSLSINGDLISDSYASLFTDTKLNTNTAIVAEWHIRLGKNHFIVDKAEIAQYAFNKGVAMQKMLYGVSENIEEKQKVQRNLLLSKYQKENITSELAIIRVRTNSIEQIVDSLFLMYPKASNQDKKAWTDSLSLYSKKMDSLKIDSTILEFKVDSLHLLITDWTNYAYTLNKKVQTEYDNKTKDLDTLISLKQVKFNWFTLIASTGKKNYYSFQDSLPFSEQVTKHNLSTWKLGIAWNYYNQSILSNHALYMNLVLVRMEDNNTYLLSTQKISEEKTIKNAIGDSVRTIEQKYNVYTDSITNYLQWNVYANIYYLFGKRTSGFHIFPSLYMPDGSKTYVNVGLGYVICFINNKKDQPVINTEGYVQFNDVFNNLKLPGKFWNRNEIGIRFSLPFSLLTK